MVAFLGPDGAGKSTIIDLLRAELSRRGIDAAYFHWQVPIRAGADRGVVTDPHGRPPRGVCMSLIKLAWLFAVAWAGWSLRVFPRRRRGDWIVLDRYFPDLICDPLRYRYGGPAGAATFMSHFMPRPDAVFILTAPAAVIRARKIEVAESELAQQISAYQRLAARLRATIVDAAAAPAEILARLRPQLGLD